MENTPLLTDTCIYTIKDYADIKQAIAAGGTGKFTEKKAWRTAERLLKAAAKEGRKVPIIFADAAHTNDGLLAWGYLDSVKLGPGQGTRYSFSSLRSMGHPYHYKHELLLKRTSVPIDVGFIRPYAICQTPNFLSVEDLPPRSLLYPWNLKRWNGWDITEVKRSIREHGPYQTRWTSERRNVSLGDRVFIIRLGEPGKKGIVGSGWITGPTFVSNGELVNPMELDVLQDIDSGDPYLHFDDLKKFDGMHWSPQRGGAEIPTKIAKKLEELWSDIVRSDRTLYEGKSVRRRADDDDSDISANELVSPGKPAAIGGLEGGLRSVTVTRAERNPKNRQACLDHYGYECLVCKFDFGQMFGANAKNYIHVHHHNLVATSGEIVPHPVNDMSPLCPNCHAVAHLKRPPYTIAELKAMRSTSPE